MEHYEIKPDIEKTLCQSIRVVGYYDAHIKYKPEMLCSLMEQHGFTQNMENLNVWNVILD